MFSKGRYNVSLKRLNGVTETKTKQVEDNGDLAGFASGTRLASDTQPN